MINIVKVILLLLFQIKSKVQFEKSRKYMMNKKPQKTVTKSHKCV